MRRRAGCEELNDSTQLSTISCIENFSVLGVGQLLHVSTECAMQGALDVLSLFLYVLL